MVLEPECVLGEEIAFVGSLAIPLRVAHFRRRSSSLAQASKLRNSRATWKVIAADLPIGVVSADAVALGDGPRRGREIEVADLFRSSSMQACATRIWMTADMHYRLHFQSARAASSKLVTPSCDGVLKRN